MEACEATPDQTIAAVRGDLERRSAVGLAKYGITVAGNPLPARAWVQHAYEEALDLAVYLRRLLDEMKSEPE
jgi:hypothetical protein